VPAPRRRCCHRGLAGRPTGKPCFDRPVGSLEAFLADALELLGPRHVLSDPDVVAGYVGDWTGRFVGTSPAVVRPGTTEEVATLVGLCRSHGVALALQGGMTSLSAGTVPLAGEVVCSLARLRGIEVDASAGQATVGAGVTLAELQDAASAAGWAYGVDLASRDSATVGGTVATNAGGIRVLRYGDTRAQLLGVEAVLGTGDVVSHLGGLLKDNTGYHLPGLLCGSEGTLGVLSAARLRLVRAAPERVVVLLAFDRTDAAVRGAGALRRSLDSLSAVELFLRPGMELVCAYGSLPDPFTTGHTAYLLAEAADADDPTGALAGAVEGLGAAEVAVATDAVRAAELWRYREAHTEAINTLGPPHKLDIAVPLGALEGFVEQVGRTVHALRPEAEVWLFGHAADGNMHVNLTGVDPDDEVVDGAVFELAASLGGSVSAEHGIGTAKRRWLHLNRTPAELSAFRSIKRALDPDGVLNPSVLFEPTGP
jgi:FAD/FMN-containing dehydrogenase